MTRKIIWGALASVALITAGTAVAKPGKGGGHGASAAAKAGPKGKGNAHSRGKKAVGEGARAQGRLNSQGPAHASPRALERASVNSVLAGNRVVDGPLTGLAVGTPVQVGDEMGTVERIVPSRKSKVSNVLVRLSSGRILPLAPGSLSNDSGMWSATSWMPNANRR